MASFERWNLQALSGSGLWFVTYNIAKSFSAEARGVDPMLDSLPVESCSFTFEGNARVVKYAYDEDYDIAHTSLREIFRGARGGGSCPSYVMLASLTPGMTNTQRDMFCLDYDETRQSYKGFKLGKADAYGVCSAPSKNICERVNDSKDAALAITGFASGAVGGSAGAMTLNGTTVVAHSSGAAILTGSGGYIAGTLGTIGTTALGVITAPATLTAAALSVIAVGSAVYVCS